MTIRDPPSWLTTARAGPRFASGLGATNAGGARVMPASEGIIMYRLLNEAVAWPYFLVAGTQANDLAARIDALQLAYLLR